MNHLKMRSHSAAISLYMGVDKSSFKLMSLSLVVDLNTPLRRIRALYVG